VLYHLGNVGANTQDSREPAMVDTCTDCPRQNSGLWGSYAKMVGRSAIPSDICTRSVLSGPASAQPSSRWMRSVPASLTNWLAIRPRSYSILFFRLSSASRRALPYRHKPWSTLRPHMNGASHFDKSRLLGFEMLN
jgi:hypothetical protein